MTYMAGYRPLVGARIPVHTGLVQLKFDSFVMPADLLKLGLSTL